MYSGWGVDNGQRPQGHWRYGQRTMTFTKDDFSRAVNYTVNCIRECITHFTRLCISLVWCLLLYIFTSQWHKKRDESLAHGFMRYSPLDDCSDRFSDCPHNRSQTHYHCIQDGCDKVRGSFSFYIYYYKFLKYFDELIVNLFCCKFPYPDYKQSGSCLKQN